MKNTSTDIGQLTETLDFQIEGAFSGDEGSEIMDSSSVTSTSDMGSRIGKGPHELSHETRRLLQKRLRAACVVLLFGFALFMIRGFFVLFPLDSRVLHLALMVF